MQRLNREQAEAIFTEKAVYLFGGDVLTKGDAENIFGRRLVNDYLNRAKPGTTYNMVSLPKVTFFLKKGFLDLVTLHNLTETEKQEREQESCRKTSKNVLQIVK